MTLSASADIDESVDLLGKSVSDLQEDITISKDGVISGRLKAVTGYTGFSGDSELQSGHYLALKLDAVGDEDAVKVEIIGGTSGEVTLDSDRIWIGYIRNKQQQIKVTATKAGHPTITKIYTLDGLTLARS